MYIKLIQKKYLLKMLIALYIFSVFIFGVQPLVGAASGVTYNRVNYGMITGSDGSVWIMEANPKSFWSAKFEKTAADPDGFKDYIQAKDTNNTSNTKDVLYVYTVTPDSVNGSKSAETATNLNNNSGAFTDIYYWVNKNTIARYPTKVANQDSIPQTTFARDGTGSVFIEQRTDTELCKDTITLGNGSVKNATYSAGDAQKGQDQAFGVYYTGNNLTNRFLVTNTKVDSCFRGDKEGDGSVAELTITNEKDSNLEPGQEAVLAAGGTNGSDPNTTAESGANECANQLRPFGWVLCPVLAFASNIYQTFVETVNNILFFSTEKYEASGLKNAWAVFVRLANVVIVLVGLVMLVGQIFKFEVFSAYTVKKVLPRLFIGAILIQLSWLLFTVMAQIVNALGSGMYWLLLSPFGFTVEDGGMVTFFQAVAQGQGGQNIGAIADNLSGFISSSALVVGAGAVVYLSGAWLTMIVAMVGVLIGVLIALVTIMLREAVLIVLLATAPLAIAAWILPATNNLWNTWWKTYSRLLMMYPLIMLLFAGGTIAAHVLAQADATVASAALGVPLLKNLGVVSDQGTNSYMMVVLQIIVFFAPMFLIGMTFKFAGSMFGSVVSMTGKLGNSLNKGAGAGMKPFSERWQGNKKVREEEKKNASLRRMHEGNATTMDRWRTGTLGVPLTQQSRDAYSRRDRKAQLQGLLSIHEDENLENKLIDTEAAEARAEWASRGLLDGPGARSHLQTMATTGTRAQRRAAQQEIIKRQDVGSWAVVQRNGDALNATVTPAMRANVDAGTATTAETTAVGLADEFNRQRGSGEFAQAFLPRRADWVKGEGAYQTWGPEGFALGDDSAYADMSRYLDDLQRTDPAQYNIAVSRIGAQLQETLSNPNTRAQALKNPGGLAAARTSLTAHFTRTSNAAGLNAVSQIDPAGTIEPIPPPARVAPPGANISPDGMFFNTDPPGTPNPNWQPTQRNN